MSIIKPVDVPGQAGLGTIQHPSVTCVSYEWRVHESGKKPPWSCPVTLSQAAAVMVGAFSVALLLSSDSQ